MYYINYQKEDIMNYEKIAEEVFEEVLKYKVKDESVNKVIETSIKKHGNYTDKELLKIESKVIHVMTIRGYDIDCVKPFKMKKYK